MPRADIDKPFVPGFETDIFVSYGHLDNWEPELWVKKLYLRVKGELEVILGEPVSFWMDPKLRGGDMLDATLKRQISRSAVFLPILSPRYVTSQYCPQELQWFVDAATESGGLEVSRIVAVEKYPPPTAPGILSNPNLLRTRFYMKDEVSGRYSTFPAKDNLPGFSDFYETCNKLASDLADVLRAMRAAQAVRAPAHKKAIFVAAAPPDKKVDRDRLVSFLSGRGYAVSGQTLTPDTRDELMKWVAQEVSAADLSIHLVSGRFGVIPDGEDHKSTIWLEYEEVRKSGKRQLIWVPDELGEVFAKQAEFLAALRDAGDEQTEIVSGSFSAFMETIPDELQKLDAKFRTHDRGVYLIFERSDLSREQLKAIRTFLEQKGFPVVNPAFQGDAALLRELEADSIASSDATLIYYGSAPDAWVLLKRRAVLNVLAELAPQNYPRALYLCEPSDDIKRNMYLEYSGKLMPDERSRFGPLLILGDCSPFRPDSLTPLLNILEMTQ
jgi:hypothetical protein